MPVLAFLGHDVAAHEREVQRAEEEHGDPGDEVPQRERGEVVIGQLALIGDALAQLLIAVPQVNQQEQGNLQQREGNEAHVSPLAGEELPQFALKLKQQRLHGDDSRAPAATFLKHS